ncbi:ASCH domain-containing protein [Microbacterium marinilacus]|uniref:ASCH domain-containing protein n=1 Tax=Microbacterium marinilacus TaxID=415209 RepID=A0ABP7B735_9MICO|nr:ASCH domain-containing protein [Microbacterium marinilacus]MBY0687509.1 ASCH domain-containing protein [Microbacterium marinilacus]
MSIPDPDPAAVAAFWDRARAAISVAEPELSLPDAPPQAWGFGATPAHADALLALVLTGTKTGTSSDARGYPATGEPVPVAGQLDVVLDGSGAPRAVILNTSIDTVPFDDVDAAHARAEGEGDRSLAHWRDVHERFFTEHAEHDQGFSPSMPVITERFRLLYP